MWLGTKNPKGYGLFYLAGKMMAAHRFSIEMSAGAIPPNLQVDHLCRNPACVKPEHLELVTPQENVRRGKAGVLRRARTHCGRGHELTEANVYVDARGRHNCRSCRAAAEARRREGQRI